MYGVMKCSEPSKTIKIMMNYVDAFIKDAFEPMIDLQLLCHFVMAW